MSSDDPSTKKPVRRFVLLALVVGGVIVAAYYSWLLYQRPTPSAPAGLELRIEQAANAPPRHPVAATPAPNGESLPPLDQSDEVLRARAADLIGARTLERLFNLDSIVRRIVVTIHNLPEQRVPQRLSVAQPVPGRFAAVHDGELVFLDRKNYERYASYVALAEAVDTAKLVALYTHFYPLFQEEYENLGYRDAYFNDRVVAAIDDLLSAPEIEGRMRLVRPRVMYEFADPELESLSAGQKIMVRMGPENAARIKAKLREIRSALTSAR